METNNPVGHKEDIFQDTKQESNKLTDILMLRDKGLSIRKIGEQLNIPKSTISDTLKRVSEPSEVVSDITSKVSEPSDIDKKVSESVQDDIIFLSNRVDKLEQSLAELINKIQEVINKKLDKLMTYYIENKLNILIESKIKEIGVLNESSYN